HREFTKTSGSLGALDGSDMLIVNPQHYAVALKYDAQTMTAPIIATKGRNRIALRLKSRAASLNIPVLANPPLARALFRQSAIGQTISADQFRAVADSYAKIARLRSGQGLRAEERGENLHQGSEAAC
ncbi:MAG: EscU/YscU/HrcU family type III secretion system export apparatus switch protein, partial [Pseudomonadota bacterium]